MPATARNIAWNNHTATAIDERPVAAGEARGLTV